VLVFFQMLKTWFDTNCKVIVMILNKILISEHIL